MERLGRMAMLGRERLGGTLKGRAGRDRTEKGWPGKGEEGWKGWAEWQCWIGRGWEGQEREGWKDWAGKGRTVNNFLRVSNC